MPQIKSLSPEAIPAAVEKALRYRVLNEPEEAESICRDILAVDPKNKEALSTLLLALTDRFSQGLSGRFEEAWELSTRMASEYDRLYYAGIIYERRAKAQHERRAPGSGYVAHDLLLQAMEWYEKAEVLRPKGNDEALLRWNTCIRIIVDR